MGYHSNPVSLFFGGPPTKVVKRLIIINAAVFGLQMVERIFRINFILPVFGLIPWRVTHDWAAWQFLTYMFLHGGFFHIFFNMFALFMFGGDLERRWGSRSFLYYYLITGVGAGLCSWIVGVHSQAVIVGASGALYGILLAYGLLYPNRLVYIYLMFPVKVKWLVLFMGVVAFFSSVTGGDPGVAHIAHLGGMLVGYILLKYGDWFSRLHTYQADRRRKELRKQFEVYYGELRRKMEDDKGKGPTIH